MSKKIILLSTALIFMLACQVASIATQAPTQTPVETAQQAPEPSLTATDEPTEIPPTETATPEPTATPIPQSGDLLYETTFNDFYDWAIETMGNEAEYTSEVSSDGLYVKVPNKDDYWAAYYDLGNNNSDVRIELDAELVGNNNYTYISIVCRSSEKGEYSFTLDTGGYWQIGKYDFEKSDYEELDYGGSTRIKVAKHPNHITAICENDELTLKINDYNISSVTDTQFADGEIGIAVETFDYPLTEVVFRNLEVYVP